MKTIIKLMIAAFTVTFVTGCNYAGWHKPGASLYEFKSDWEGAKDDAKVYVVRQNAENMEKAKRKDMWEGGGSNRMAAGIVGAMFFNMEVDMYTKNYMPRRGWEQLTKKQQKELQVIVYKWDKEGVAIEAPPPPPDVEPADEKEAEVNP
jgi:hypothetical protein